MGAVTASTGYGLQPPAPELSALLHEFGMRATTARPLTGGMENIHLQVETDQGAIVVTMLRKKTFEDAEHYARFLRSLAEVNAPMPRLRQRQDGGWVARHRGYPTIVCDYLVGQQFPVVAPDLVELVGYAVGRVHRDAAGLTCPLRPHLRLQEHERAMLAALPDSAFAQWAHATAEETAYVTKRPGPMVPVHADLFPDNLLFRKAGAANQVVFLDWEDSSLDFPEIDVGMALLGLCCTPGFSVPHARRLLRGYRSATGAQLDHRLLGDAARFVALIVALRRYRWHLNGRSQDPARSHLATVDAATSLARRWPEVLRDNRPP